MTPGDSEDTVPALSNAIFAVPRQSSRMALANATVAGASSGHYCGGTCRLHPIWVGAAFSLSLGGGTACCMLFIACRSLRASARARMESYRHEATVMTIQAAVISMPTTSFVRPLPAADDSVASAPNTADASAPALPHGSTTPASDPIARGDTAADECSICLSEFVAGEQTKRLPCVYIRQWPLVPAPDRPPHPPPRLRCWAGSHCCRHHVCPQ